jgi:hypothetical protein
MRSMRKTACTIGAFVAGAGMLTGGTAFADSADNDGVNIGNDNNASVLPIQLCGNNIAVLGAVVPIASPQKVVCTNAPVVDHPQQPPAEKPPAEKPPMEKPPVEEPPNDQKPPMENSPEELPEAPTPVAVQGHHAVTG